MTQNPDIHDALLIVDPQVDFCPGGALAVPSGDTIFPAVNRASRMIPLTIASRDWHPAGHVSYAAQGGPWPAHCQAGTPGAEFHPALERDRIEHVFTKGTEVSREAYSAFDDTGVAAWLRARGGAAGAHAAARGRPRRDRHRHAGRRTGRVGEHRGYGAAVDARGAGPARLRRAPPARLGSARGAGPQQRVGVATTICRMAATPSTCP